MNNNIPKILSGMDTGFELAALLAFIHVETGGEGFNRNGTMKIQFEPTWFKRLSPKSPKTDWSKNRVENQPSEWRAFNDAYKYDPEKAIRSTSFGLGQIMGFNYKLCGYSNATDMWNDAEKGLKTQLIQMLSFINSNKKLAQAINNHEWAICAYYYNGSGYKAQAKKLGIVPYDKQLANAYKIYSSKYK